MVVVRLSREGAKKRPFYHIVVADKGCPRDGRFIDRIGYYNPIARGKEILLAIDNKQLVDWISKGAQLSKRVKSLIKTYKKMQAQTLSDGHQLSPTEEVTSA